MSFVELYRSSVQTWETDGMGHMNVQFYSEKATNALAALSLHLGHGRDEIARTGTRLVAEDHHIRFLREQRPGAPIFIRGGVVEADANRLTCYFEVMLQRPFLPTHLSGQMQTAHKPPSLMR